MEISYPELWFLEASVRSDAAWLPFPLLMDSREDRRNGVNAQYAIAANGLSLQAMSEVLWTLFVNRMSGLNLVDYTLSRRNLNPILLHVSESC